MRALPTLLCTAALAAAAQAAIPLPFSEVPLTLQSAVVCFAGLTLGFGRTLLAVVLYLGLGIAGLPVFAAGEGGLDAVRGPTGGYLVGFVPALPALALGRFLFGGSHRLIRASMAALLAHLVILVLGVLWLREVQVWSWYRTLEAGFWPFLPGAAVKSVLVGLLVAWTEAAEKPAPSKVKPRAR